MAVVKEYQCLAHGDFDAREPVCPHGCTGDLMILRVYRTAPAFQSQGYRNINRSAAQFAADHGLSNIDQRGGDGGRRTDYATHRNTTRAMQMLGHGERSNFDLNQYFQPVSAMGAYGGVPGSLTKDAATGQVIATDGQGNRAHSFGQVRPVLEAPAFDGSNLGLPAGDA